MVGPLGVGFRLDPAWRHIVVLGRGVGIATLGPISQLARDNDVGVTAILSARDADFVMADTFFREAGDVVSVLDTDGTSAVENVEKILGDLIAQNRADAFFTCGSNRLFQLMKRLGKAHNIPGQVAMEQVMACGLGPCYVCVRTFEVNGKKELRRVCIEGPVFDMQEAVGWYGRYARQDRRGDAAKSGHARRPAVSRPISPRSWTSTGSAPWWRRPCRANTAPAIRRRAPPRSKAA